MISVIIATLNRAEAMAKMSLPSLLLQDTSDFEVIVWDASEDDETKDLCESLGGEFNNIGATLRYFKAPRRGSSSQRNDAAKVALGSVLFFIDDDSEVSPDGLSVLSGYFNTFGWLMGAALPLVNKSPKGSMGLFRSILSKLRRLVFPIFFGFEDKRYRKIRSSTGNIYPIVDSPGVAEWLTGACMAFRSTVFDSLSFEERLQRFGGYALGEDYDLSHRVFLKYGEPLLILSSGMVVHHNFGSGRIYGKNRAAAFYYNTAIIRENFNKYATYGLLPFLWEQRIGRTLALIVDGISIPDIVRGYVEYRKAIRCR